MTQTSWLPEQPGVTAARRTGLLARHPLFVHFVLAHAFSWAVELPLAASAQGWLRRPVPYWFHYFAGYGPLLAAFVTAWIGEGSVGARDLLRRMDRWRVPLGWWVVALSPVFLYLAAAAGLRAAGAISFSSRPLVVIGIGAVTGLAAGLLVGAVHGLVLVRLLAVANPELDM